MTTENELLLALELVAEGSAANVPDHVDLDVFTAEYAAAADAVRDDHRDWVYGEGVQGLGIGQRVTSGEAQDDLAIRLYVEAKRPLAALDHPAPPTFEVPELGPVPVDVVAIGRLELESAPYTARIRPAMPGCSVGHPRVTAGTFGLVVRHQDTDATMILSNSHVLANEGDATKGDDTLQPGVLDGGRTPADVIGSLFDWVPFEFADTGFTNLVDAAIATVDRSETIDTIRLIDTKPVKTNTDISRGTAVQKVGRTSNETTGVVTDVNAKLQLNYKVPGGGGSTRRVGLTDQVLCTRYTEPGDSGAVVLNMDGELVGLHFAGSPAASAFNKIQHVFELLTLSLD